MSGGWNTIESDAGVFTDLLTNLGVKGVQFEELLSLEPDALAQLHPVYGVIFLFKYPTNQPYRGTDKPLDGTFDYDASERLFFAHQTIQNACGTQALLSVLLNKADPSISQEGDAGYIDIGDKLRDFRDFTIALPAEIRGEALSNSELIRDTHNSFARSSPFVDETQRRPDEEDGDAFHFIAYSPIGGTLYELDGLQPAPISHGACTQEDFPQKVMDVLQRRIARYDASEIRFNLLAMIRDLRIRAREFADEDLLANEERKREAWRFENALRRHNFVGFAGEILKGVVSAKLTEGGSAYDDWVNQGKKKMEKRAAEQRARKGGEAEDVEMQG